MDIQAPDDLVAWEAPGSARSLIGVGLTVCSACCTVTIIYNDTALQHAPTDIPSRAVGPQGDFMASLTPPLPLGDEGGDGVGAYTPSRSEERGQRNAMKRGAGWRAPPGRL